MRESSRDAFARSLQAIRTSASRQTSPTFASARFSSSASDDRSSSPGAFAVAARLAAPAWRGGSRGSSRAAARHRRTRAPASASLRRLGDRRRRTTDGGRAALIWPRDDVKLERVRALMDERGLDALVVRAPDNVLYLTNFWAMKGYEVCVF